MMMSENQSEQIKSSIKTQLDALIDPYTKKKSTAAKGLKSITITDEHVNVVLQKGYPIASVTDQLVDAVKESLQAISLGNRALEVVIEQNIISHSVQQGVQPIEGVKNIIAVASGKGGVGKSTVSSNLALALAKAGANVAMLDADIYGPSQPRMLGAVDGPETLPNKMLLPVQSHGLKIMSIGFMVDDDTPMIWRGPMVTQALEQMLRGTQWVSKGEPEIDYMIIDLPPGTGDIQLTLSQRVPVTGAVIVTTPQDIALLDARKAVNMFKKVEVPVLGVIENMSTHVCSKCGHEEAIFGTEGADKMARDFDLAVLGHIPLLRSIRENADAGKPTVVAEPDSQTANNYRDIALNCAASIAVKKKDFSASFPNIVVENS